MILTDSDTYHKLKLYDLVDLKCDSCSGVYQKSKRAWYFSAYKKKIGLDFQSKSYCSNKCRGRRYEKTRKQYNCLECNKEFNALIKENPKFCNHSCAAKFNNKKRDGNKLVICCDCSVEFLIWKSRDQKIFRCKLCIEEKNKTIKEEKSKLFKIRISNINRLICKCCSNIFESNIKNKIYCSFDCQKKSRKQYQHTCVGCDIVFINTEKISKYCSRSCRSINLNLSSYARKAKAKYRELNKHLRIDDIAKIKYKCADQECICSICSEKFYTTKDRKRKNCGKTCKSLSLSIQRQNYMMKNGNFSTFREEFRYKNITIEVDSNLEKAAIVYLSDKMNAESIERFKNILNYNDGFKNRTYNPDFTCSINGQIHIIEVKQKWLPLSKHKYNTDIPYKRKALEEYCIKNNFKSIWMDFNTTPELKDFYKKILKERK